MAVSRTVSNLRRDLDELRYSGLDSIAMRLEIVDRLRSWLPFQAHGFATADPSSLTVTGALSDGVDPEQGPNVAKNEYLHRDVNKHEWLVRSGQVASLYAATFGDVTQSHRWRTILRHDGVVDELRAALVDRGACWGYLHLFRVKGHARFSPGDADLLASVTSTMAELLRIALVLGPSGDSEPAPDGPGIVVLDADDHAIEASPNADYWIGRMLKGERWLARRAFPEALANVVYALRAQPDRHPHGVHSLQRTPGGTWLSLDSARAGDDGRVVVVVQPAHPQELLGVFLDGYGLTGAERATVGLVVQGLSTEQIAESLHVSPYTVQDRLKQVFSKAGVRSRRQLVAAITPLQT